MITFILKSNNTNHSGARLAASIPDSKVVMIQQLEDGTEKLDMNDLNIYWGINRDGFTNLDYKYETTLNHPSASIVALDKLETFKVLKEKGNVNIPKFWTKWNKAIEYLYEDNSRVLYERNLLKSYGGKGIVIRKVNEQLNENCKLFVAGIIPECELRIHLIKDYLGNNEYYYIQRKRRLNKDSRIERKVKLNTRVKNIHNGYIYSGHIDLPEDLLVKCIEQASLTLDDLNLQYGAVDIIVEKDTNKPIVLEVNTNPGLTSDATLAFYVSSLTHLFKSINKAFDIQVQ